VERLTANKAKQHRRRKKCGIKVPRPRVPLATVLVPSDAAVARLIRQGEQCGQSSSMLMQSPDLSLF
jgi:hypothetical protein